MTVIESIEDYYLLKEIKFVKFESHLVVLYAFEFTVDIVGKVQM